MSLIEVVNHLFLPHESNNHRPKLLNPYAYLFYIVFFIVFGFGTKLVYRLAPNILGIATNISVSDLLDLTNQKRMAVGLPLLSLNSQLSEAANKKALDMFKDNYWAHYNPNGKSPWDFIVGSGYKYIYAGENLAKDFNDSSGVVEAWMASPSHRDNILKPEYKDIGFAVVNGVLNGQETTLVVQMFGTGSSVSASSSFAGSSNKMGSVQRPVVEVSPSISPPVYIAGVRKAPLVDIGYLKKNLTLLLLMVLIMILIVDGFLIWFRKTTRVSSHNFAHLIFIGFLLTVIWLTTRGSIL